MKNKRIVWGISLSALCILIAAVWFGLARLRSTEKLPGSDISPPVRPQLSIMVPLHQAKEPSNQLMKELTAKTGYELQVQWIADDIYSSKLLNMLESNSISQAVFVKPEDFSIVKDAIRSNMFWNIGPYLEYYPNLKTLNNSSLKQSSVDGKIYGLYNERPESRQGVIIRKDWLDKLGLSEPHNLDDLYKVMKAFTTQDPDGNGKGDTVGLADRNDLYYGAFKTLGSYFGVPNNWALTNGRLVPEFATDSYIKTMDFVKKLYEEGLVNKDFPVTSKSVQRYMIISGKAGVYIGSMSDAPRLLEETRQVNPNAQFTVINRIAGPQGERVWSNPGNTGMFLFSKKSIKTEDQLKQALAFFDRTMDKDVSNLLYYGMENEHYKLINGMVSIPTEMFKRVNEEVTPLLSLMIANISNPNLYKRSEEGTDPFLWQVSKLVEDNSNILVPDPTVGLSSPAYDARSLDLNSIISNATYNYILGKLDAAGFRKELDNWRERGGNQVIQELEEAYRTQP